MYVSRKRSVFKSLTWRLLGTTDTFILSLIIINLNSNEFYWKMASSIAILEIFTKTFLYYFHERAWNRVKWGRIDTVKRLRSFFKALSWRCLATLDTFLISFIITSELYWATSIALFEIFTKAIIYYYHERTWNRVKWGRY